MKHLICLVLAMSLIGCASKMELATNLLIIADWSQTRQLEDHPELYESNMFLGDHPSKERIDAYHIFRLVSNSLLHRYLPKKPLRFWQFYVVVSQVDAVKHNYDMGLKIKF